MGLAYAYPRPAASGIAVYQQHIVTHIVYASDTLHNVVLGLV